MVVLNIGSLEYRTGRLSNYSMGVSVYACFIMVGIYIILTFVAFFRRWNYIESHKRASIFTYLLALLPIVIFYIICQKQIIGGVANGAVKG